MEQFFITKISDRISQFIQRVILDNIVLSIFILFLIIGAIFGYWYCTSLNPAEEKVLELIGKLTVDEYKIPEYAAERYLIWRSMRTFFFTLDYLLTLLSILASLMTVFYASKDGQYIQVVRSGKTAQPTQCERRPHVNANKKGQSTIVFLSLLALCFTISNFFIEAGSKANMSQHAWRELDICIMETLYKTELTENDKNLIIINKVVEMEQYIESFEH